MPTHSALPLALSFLAGILLTLSLTELYPDLRRHFRPRPNHAVNEETAQAKAKADARAVEGIGEGIESCIGKTPLFRIKSLSEATGCEILGKAEVGAGFDYVYLELL